MPCKSKSEGIPPFEIASRLLVVQESLRSIHTSQLPFCHYQRLHSEVTHFPQVLVCHNHPLLKRLPRDVCCSYSAFTCVVFQCRATILAGDPIMQPNSLWREMLRVGGLVFFAAIGVAHVVCPDQFIPQYLIQKHGLPPLRMWYRICGAGLAGFSIYVFYTVYFRG